MATSTRLQVNASISCHDLAASGRLRPARRRVHCILLVACLAGWAGAVPCVQAAEQGALGPTYPIVEEHLLLQIERRLREKERSGELERLRLQAVRNVRRAVEQPVAQDLPPTTRPRTRYWDPTYELPSHLLDAQGRILFAAGTRANPLDIVRMPRRLLFFDARDPRQVDYAAKLLAQPGLPIKPVLTGGSYLALMQRWRTRVYYDQRGLLTARLGIVSVPTLVSQEGRRLRIDELELRQ